MGAGPSKNADNNNNNHNHHDNNNHHHDTPVADIVIAGGGIVGLTLAMALHKHLHLTAEIYDKAAGLQTEAGAGLGMYPNGLRVLRDISPALLQAVRAAGQPYQQRLWERHDGSTVMAAKEALLASDQADLEPLGIRRSRLQTVLHRYATVVGLSVHWNKPLKTAVPQPDGLIRVTFADGTTRLTRVLFGADGALGVSRSLVAPHDDGSGLPALQYTGVTCLMGLSKVTTDGIYFPSSDQDDFHAVLFPTGPDESCFQFHVPVSEQDANKLNWGNLSQGVGRAECAKIAQELRTQGWHDKYIKPLEEEHLIQAVRVGFCLLERPLDSWVKGRIALVGDAAHPPVPYIGQGAQQGLEDAGVVASLLKIYCVNAETGAFDPTNFTKAMQLYQDIRQKRSLQILEFSQSLGNMQAARSKSADDQDRIMADHVLKGEILMYGTLPIMLPGAGHDYKEDVQQATDALDLPEISQEATLEALEHLLGFVPPQSPNPQADGVSPRVKKKKMEFHLPEMYSLPEDRVRDLSDWLAEGLKVHLKRIVAHHETLAAANAPLETHDIRTQAGQPVSEEVSQILQVRDHTENSDNVEVDPNWVRLSPPVVTQLRHYISAVADLYPDHPFHNFEHACNVTVAVSKFLTRLSTVPNATLTLNGHAYGLVSDPVVQFGLVLAALLHDAGHEGVPGARDASSTSPRAASFETAFGLFMDNPRYRDLRNTICRDEEERDRFHQLLMDSIKTTHIFDEQVKERRWADGGTESKTIDPAEDAADNAQIGTVAVEALIQASDVLHTMQPWAVYREWNERMFAEQYKSYREGRIDVDPGSFWFKGEIGFFDLYILPLAKRLRACGVFGSLGNECWAFAKANRLAWRLKGPSAVNEMIRKVALEQSMSEWN